MNQRKTFWSIVWVLVLLIGSSGCNTVVQRALSVSNLARRIVATPNALPPELTPTPVPSNLSTAALVKLRSNIRVGIRFDAPPLASINKNGELEGLDVDIAREFARRWLGSERNVEFVQVTSASAPRRLKARQLDLALGGIAISRNAEQDADFSLPYFVDGEALLIRTGSYADFASMNSKEIFYIDTSSLPALSIGQISAGITVTFKSEVSYDNAVRALLDQRTEGVLGRWRRFALITQRDPALSVLTIFNAEPVAVVLPQNDSQWADLVNLTLSQMMADGFYAQAYQKWFGTAPNLQPFIPKPAPLPLAKLNDGLNVADTLARLKTNNTVRIGFVARAAPLGVLTGLDEGSQPIGYEIDTAREIAQRLLPGNATSFVPLADNQIAQALATGQVDLVVGALARNDANEKAYDFSVPLLELGAGTTTSTTAQLANSFGGASIGVALPMNDSAFRDTVNNALADMRNDGTTESFRVKWLGQ